MVVVVEEQWKVNVSSNSEYQSTKVVTTRDRVESSESALVCFPLRYSSASLGILIPSQSYDITDKQVIRVTLGDSCESSPIALILMTTIYIQRRRWYNTN